MDSGKSTFIPTVYCDVGIYMAALVVVNRDSKGRKCRSLTACGNLGGALPRAKTSLSCIIGRKLLMDGRIKDAVNVLHRKNCLLD